MGCFDGVCPVEPLQIALLIEGGYCAYLFYPLNAFCRSWSLFKDTTKLAHQGFVTCRTPTSANARSAMGCHQPQLGLLLTLFESAAMIDFRESCG